MKMDKVGIACLVIPLIIVSVLYPYLPASIPIHWSLDGTVRTAPKIYTFLIALLPYVVYLKYGQKRR